MEGPALHEEPQELASTDRHAVYRCFAADGQLLYIGTSGAFGRRLAAHAQKIWFLEVRGITLEWYPDDRSAEAAERRAIHVEQPKYNVVHKNGRLCPVPGAVRPAITATPPRPSRPVVERRIAFARALDRASGEGVTPRELIFASGIGRSHAHQLLIALLDAGVIVRVARGCYRVIPGRSAEAAMSDGRLPMRKIAIAAIVALALYLIARHPHSIGTFTHTYTHSHTHHRSARFTGTSQRTGQR